MDCGTEIRSEKVHSMKKALLMSAILALGLSGAAYAQSPSFKIGGATGTAITSSGGGSNSTSGSASIGGGMAGGFTAGFSTTNGGAMAAGGANGVQVGDTRTSASGGLNFSGSTGYAGTINATQAGAGGHEGATATFGNFSGKLSGFPAL